MHPNISITKASTNIATAPVEMVLFSTLVFVSLRRESNRNPQLTNYSKKKMPAKTANQISKPSLLSSFYFINMVVNTLKIAYRTKPLNKIQEISLFFELMSFSSIASSIFNAMLQYLREKIQ